MTTKMFVQAIDREDACSLLAQFDERHTGVTVTITNMDGESIAIPMDKRLLAGFAKQLHGVLNYNGARAARCGTTDDWMLLCGFEEGES